LNYKEIILFVGTACVISLFFIILGRSIVKLSISTNNYYLSLTLRLFGVFGAIWMGLSISSYIFQAEYFLHANRSLRLAFLACWVIPFLFSLFPLVFKNKP